MDNTNIKDFITCPITSMIFLDPVTARDGIVYERKALEQWFENKNTSPVTAERIKKKLVPAYLVKNIVDEILINYPEWKKDQYIPPKLDHMLNCDDVNDIISQKKYGELLKFCNFDINELVEFDSFLTFLCEAPIDTVKYVIDNSQTLDPMNKHYVLHEIANYGRSELVVYLIGKDLELLKRDRFGKTVLHYICEKCDMNAINCVRKDIAASKITSNAQMACIHYLLQNKTITDDDIVNVLEIFEDFELGTKKSKRPIHYVCQNMGPKAVNYLLDKKVELDITDVDGNYPVHYLIDNMRINDTEKSGLLDKFPNLEHKNKEGQRPIHLACDLKNNNHDVLIKYLVDRKVELNCSDNDNWNPIHYLCNETPYTSMIIYLLMQKVDLECKTNKEVKPVHMVAKPSTLSILKLLINAGAQMEDVPAKSD